MNQRRMGLRKTRFSIKVDVRRGQDDKPRRRERQNEGQDEDRRKVEPKMNGAKEDLILLFGSTKNSDKNERRREKVNESLGQFFPSFVILLFFFRASQKTRLF